MGTIVLQTPLLGQPNATEDAKVASDFNVLQTAINGGLDTNNLSPTAGIVGGQLSATAGITRAQLAAGAAGLTTVVASGNVTAVNGQMVLCESGLPLTVTLPAPIMSGNVGVWSPATTGAFPVTVTAAGGVIYGLGCSAVASIPLGSNGSFVVLQGDGTNWTIVGGQQDTGWVPLSLASGITAAPFSYPPSACLRGDTVTLKGAIFNSTGSPWGPLVTFTTIPTPLLRPSVGAVTVLASQYTAAYAISQYTPVVIRPDGTLSGTNVIGINAYLDLNGINFQVS